MKIFELSKDYKEIKKIDLQRDTKLAILVNLFSLLLVFLTLAVGNAIVPIKIDFEVWLENPMKFFTVSIIVFGSMTLYMILHELVHGAFFKKYSGQKASYGFTGMYAFAKSDAFYNKKEYIIIGLSPIVIWGIVLALLNVFLDKSLFWYVFIIQVFNISGGAGDLYVAFVLRKYPSDILVQDEGVNMTIFEKSK